MSYYSDPTASKAIGAVDKELRQMQQKARHIKALKEKGRLTTEDLELARKQFVGIYRRLLVEALSDKQKRKRLPADAGSHSMKSHVFSNGTIRSMGLHFTNDCSARKYTAEHPFREICKEQASLSTQM